MSTVDNKRVYDVFILLSTLPTVNHRVVDTKEQYDTMLIYSVLILGLSYCKQTDDCDNISPSSEIKCFSVITRDSRSFIRCIFCFVDNHHFVH